MIYPTLTPENTTQDYIDVFGGYNHNYRIQENEFYDMKNMSSSCFPLLSTRPPRGGRAHGGNVVGMLYRSDYYYLTAEVGSNETVVLDLIKNSALLKRFELQTTYMGLRKLVMMGAYILIFPDKLYVNTVNIEDSGSIEAETSVTPTNDDITVQLCYADGSPILIDYVGEEPPVAPNDNFIWIDTLVEPNIIKRYYSANSMWMAESGRYFKITVPDKNYAIDFKEGDGIKITGVPELADNAAPIIHKIERTEDSTSIIINAPCNFDPNLTSYEIAESATVTGRIKIICDDTYDNNDPRLTNVDVIIGSSKRLCTTNDNKSVSYEWVVEEDNDLTNLSNTVTSVNRDQSGVYDIEVTLDTANNETLIEYPYNGDGINVRLGNSKVPNIFNVYTVSGQSYLHKRRRSGSQPVYVPAGTVFYPMKQDTNKAVYTTTLLLKSSVSGVKEGERVYFPLAYTRKQVDTLTLSRKAPIMDTDFIIESNNRLWGCRYGLNREGDFVNEIYASKLGDFTNWQYYDGTAADSYAASCGTDGEWTGVANYLGHPVFFKENYIHTVYGSYPSQYQINVNAARGVQSGSEKSLVILNETLYYMSNDGICAYNGSLPTNISTALGDIRYHDAVACAYDGKYYIDMKGKSETVLMVYDTKRNLWHKEDDLDVEEFCAVDDDVLYVDANDMVTYSLFGNNTDPIKWYVETGLFGLSDPNQKYISKLNIRLSLDIGSEVTVAIQYNGSGVWERLCTIERPDLNPFTLPIKPRRCDHFRLRLEGSGGIKIYSIAKTIEQGSDR